MISARIFMNTSMLLFVLGLIKCSLSNKTIENEAIADGAKILNFIDHSFDIYGNGTTESTRNITTTTQRVPLIEPMQGIFIEYENLVLASGILFIGFLLTLLIATIMRKIKNEDIKDILISSTSGAALGILVHIFIWQLIPLYLVSSVGHNIFALLLLAMLVLVISFLSSFYKISESTPETDVFFFAGNEPKLTYFSMI